MQSPGAIAFTVGGFEIRWYGILIAAGMLIAILIAARRAKIYGIDEDTALDAAIVMIPVGIIGARLYYILFNWSYYKGDIMKILDMRSGGLAIHGGLIFGVLALWLLCRKRKTPLIEMLDLYFPVVALAQAIGRWGNFFNEEAHGVETALPWAQLIDGKYYHPAFLYESIWCLIIFIVLSRLYKNRKFPGQIAALYGIMYSAERFFVEGLRTDSLMIGSFRQAQVISICIFVACIILYGILATRNKTKPTK